MFFRRIPEITAEDLAKELESAHPPKLLDVREPSETAVSTLPTAILVPMGQVQSKLNSMDKEADWVVYCHSGARSSSVVQYMQGQGFKNVRNLKGGILSWARAVQPGMRVG